MSRLPAERLSMSSFFLTNLEQEKKTEGRPTMSRVTTRKRGSKVNVGEVASRVGVQVYHTGQGQDERTRPAHLLRGLDSPWSEALNPHRAPGTQWRAAAN